jgi:serine/threonine-protein kinase HipA
MTAPDHKQLAVLMDGRRAGVVTEGAGGAGDRLELTYDDAWRADRHATPLSLSMPLTVRSHPDQVVRAYLWGLLPDNGHILERWARRYQVSARNPFALLRQVGEDCAGAAQFVQPARVDALLRQEGAVSWLDDAEVAERLRTLRRDPSAWHPATGGQFSLAGAQAKLALHHDPESGGWGDPAGAIPTTPRTTR